MAFGGARRRILLLVIGIGFFIIIVNLLSLPGSSDIRSAIDKVPLPKKLKGDPEDALLSSPHKPQDAHPISALMARADMRWREYEGKRSQTFKETVSKYRRKYNRHPPPGFKEWYKFARAQTIFNVDDFDQVMDDLRPFWAVEPQVIRTLAAHMSDKPDEGVAGIHIRGHKVVKLTNQSWRSETMAKVIERFIKYLPDMDIAVNRLDQPRVVVPWDDMQELLEKEVKSRQMQPEAHDEFTANMTNFLDTTKEKYEGPREDPGWYGAPGKQYMDIAKTACPPDSHAREGGMSQAAAEARYKDRMGGIITNFNLSSDLCTIGPEIQDKHGFLFSASSISATKRLVPVFGECKVNINSDILFPANMYSRPDERYAYNDKHDSEWKDKKDNMIWRGVTSGGANVEESWRRMHRNRLVLATNGTEMANQEVRILIEQPEAKGEYENFRKFKPSEFAERYTDVGFTEFKDCFPNCSYIYDNVMVTKEEVRLPEQFKSKFLVDVDGHSFSGRWRAFLESKSLGIKATIFREWHDSRLFAWRHFVPMDNRYDDLYSLLTYFIGLGNPETAGKPGEVFVAKHDTEAKRIALQGREWANKVLRKEDIEVWKDCFPHAAEYADRRQIYMYRLLLEYARIIDDNRDRIGYSGDGSELDKNNARNGTYGIGRFW